MPFRTVAAEAGAGGANSHVDEVGQLIVGGADAGADEGREAIPGAEVDKGVTEEHPGFDVALVGVALAGERIVNTTRVDLSLGAIFASDVETQPVVPLVAGTATDEERVGIGILIEHEAGRVRGVLEEVEFEGVG